jgi:hypothetical protein
VDYHRTRPESGSSAWRVKSNVVIRFVVTVSRRHPVISGVFGKCPDTEKKMIPVSESSREDLENIGTSTAIRIATQDAGDRKGWGDRIWRETLGSPGVLRAPPASKLCPRLYHSFHLNVPGKSRTGHLANDPDFVDGLFSKHRRLPRDRVVRGRWSNDDTS